MNKKELIQTIALNTEIKQKEVAKVLDVLLETLTEAMSKNDKVQLTGFGTFETRERAERIGRNPFTGEKITITPATIPVFRPGKGLKERMKQG